MDRRKRSTSLDLEDARRTIGSGMGSSSSRHWPGTRSDRRCGSRLLSGIDTVAEYCRRVKLKSPMAWSKLKTLWSDVVEEKAANGFSAFLGKDRAYFIAKKQLTDADSVSEFTFGPSPLVKELLEAEGAAPPLRRQLESLWQSSDSQSDLTFLMNPGFLRSEGRMSSRHLRRDSMNRSRRSSLQNFRAS